MKAIGGYFELECGHTPLYHQEGIYLNICRSGLRYLIRTLGIKHMHVPIYTCHVVKGTICQEGCEVINYHLTEDLMPAIDFPKDDYIVYNNYFGCLGNNVEELAKRYPNLIVDNAQAFYATPKGRADIYSPRKFFGLPDSGILKGRDIPHLDLPQGHSIYVCSHLLRRLDFDAQAGYKEFARNDEALEQYPLERISPLTLALMGNINYEEAKQKRMVNFNYLHQHLQSSFPFAMTEDDVPMVYPLYLENGDEVRTKLIQNQIFVARYWPNVLNDAKPTDLEFSLTMNILPLPIDQRYGTEDMSRIISIINTYK